MTSEFLVLDARAEIELDEVEGAIGLFRGGAVGEMALFEYGKRDRVGLGSLVPKAHGYEVCGLASDVGRDCCEGGSYRKRTEGDDCVLHPEWIWSWLRTKRGSVLSEEWIYNEFNDKVKKPVPRRQRDE